MTLKLNGRRPNSVKLGRKLRRIPAMKRLSDFMRAGWLHRYAEKHLGRLGRARDTEE